MNFEHLNNLKEQKNEQKDSAPAYVFKKHGELVGNERQSHGECFYHNRDWQHKKESQEVHVAR